MKNLAKVLLISLLTISMLAGCSKTEAPAGTEETNTETNSEAADETASEAYAVEMHATVTDAGQYVDKMVIDFGDKKIDGNSVDNETFEVM
ncbi:MAG: hypothetical protein ACI4P1_04335, partial [Erysipelotrichaceae bacterium]